MELSSKKRKRTLRIVIIAVAVLGLIALAFSMLAPRNESNPKDIVIPKKDTVSAKAVVMEDPAISEDSIRREIEREKEREREGYAKELERFDEVLQQASDEELFVVLKYAIANQYVPNRDVDPYGYVFAGITSLHRSYLIYEKLSSRKDLLSKIYPNVQVLDEYVHWGRNSGRPYKNIIVSRTILHNAQKDKKKMDAQMGSIYDTSSMAYKYFGTPLMR